MPSDPRLVSDVRRIGVLRANALGDFIYVLPAVDALRAAYPDAEIVLLARDWHRDFLAVRPSPVDRVIPLPEGIPADSGPPLPEDEQRRLLDDIAAEGWDIGLQLHGGGRHSNPVVRALRPRVSAGSGTPDAAPLDRPIRYVYWQHEIARLLEAVGLVGATPVTLEPRLAVVPADRVALATAARELEGRQYAVLHPGASDPRRRWPPASFAAVGDELARRGLAVAVSGSREEAELVAEVAARMTTPAVDLAGRLDLSGLIGLVAGAEVVVANDTGPLHVAGAVGTPTVGIYWCGNALTAGLPYRGRSRIEISWRVDCPICARSCIDDPCDHRPSFVAEVPVERVIADALDLLDDRGRASVAADEPLAVPSR